MDKTALVYPAVVLLTGTAKLIVEIWKERRNNPRPPKRLRPSDHEIDATGKGDDGEDKVA